MPHSVRLYYQRLHSLSPSFLRHAYQGFGLHRKRAGCPLYLMIATLSALIQIAFGSAVLAEDGHRQHGAHQHGLGQLGIVQEASDLSFILQAPASDLVGFEHPAQTKEDSEAVSNLESILSQAEKLFILSSRARCKLVDHTLKHALKKKNHGDNPTHPHDHSSHSHHQSHDAHSEHDATSHSEVSAEYHFFCENSPVLETVEVALFQRFSSLKKIDVSVVTPSYQGKQHLNPASSTVKLKQ